MPGGSDHKKPHEEKETIISFVKDIQLMMYGLGDCSAPLKESAELIEKIVIEQISLIMGQAKEIMILRGGNGFSPEDIIYLIKRNKLALKRFLTFMSVKDEKQALNFVFKEIQYLVANRKEPQPMKSWEEGRTEYCMRVLSKFGIDELEILSIVDVIKEKRAERACKLSLTLSPQAYQKFHAARCESFVSAHMSYKKFHEWLKARTVYGDDLSAAMLEILVYFAKETIASLIDMIMTIREDNGVICLNSMKITTDEIREAIRRHTYQQTLTFAPFSRDLPQTIHSRLIAF